MEPCQRNFDQEIVLRPVDYPTLPFNPNPTNITHGSKRFDKTHNEKRAFSADNYTQQDAVEWLITDPKNGVNDLDGAIQVSYNDATPPPARQCELCTRFVGGGIYKYRAP